MRMNKLLNIINKTLNDIYVDDCNCIICDKELSIKNRYGLCRNCLKDIPKNNGKVCIRCGKPIYDEAEYCMVCQNNERFFDRVNSPLVYKGTSEKLILNYKFYNKRYLVKYLVSYLVDEYLDKGYNSDIIIPVPLTDNVLRERSFSQTDLIAEELGKRLNIPVGIDIVKKIKDTAHQAKLGGKERQLNVAGAFSLIGNVKGMKVLIVDDILTTGATLSELARIIWKGKPLAVEGLTIANAEYKAYGE